MTGSYPFSAAESATYCLVKNAVKMFKDIGVSVRHLWYKSLYLLLFLFRSSVFEPPRVGVDPEKSSFCWIDYGGISGVWRGGGY